MLNRRAVTLLIIVCCSSYTLHAGDNPRTVRAVRITIPPQIDGIPDEEIWKSAQPATDFIQRDPDEGKAASERSEIRVLYDDKALYFGCLFFDSQPEKIVARLSRRDDEIEADEASIRIDSYHDHQTGFEFTFNAAGVKVDILQYDDAQKEDESWDPVWELRTEVVTHGWPGNEAFRGWTAELRIPFRILRYRISDTSAEQEWGINFLRHISRKQEDERWAFTPKSETGFISRFGHFTGLRDLPTPRQFEVLPFVVAKQNYEPETPLRRGHAKFLGDAGLDLRYGLATNTTLDLTINPDFGQVEADPAVLNLSVYETFYPEKRPFFIEGTQIIRFTTFGGDFGPGMFYSRRIGRGISERDVNVPANGRIESLPQTVTILGAGKLSGKTVGGFSFGVLQAVTKEERAVVVDSSGNESEQVVEPLAHYSVVRLKQDVLDGSNVGMIVTSTEKQFRNPAFTGGVDWLLKFDRNTYQLNGFLALSHTTGDNDDRVTGSAGKVEYSKIAGVHWLWGVSTDFTSKRYNINDVGFFFRPNDYGVTFSLTYKEDVPASVTRNYNLLLILAERRNFDGAELTFVGVESPVRGARLQSSLLFTNYWSITASVSNDVGGFDDRETRGTGLYKVPSSISSTLYVFSDNRQDVVGKAGVRYGQNTQSYRREAVEVGLQLKPYSWMQYEFGAEYVRNRNLETWVDNVVVGGATQSIFGDRSTDQYNLTLRSTVTFTRDLTLQVYGQVFLAKGHYENFRQLVGTSHFTQATYAGSDFNRHSFNTNIVLRWEYLPGSTMFLVWSQARNGDTGSYFTSFGQNFDNTFQFAPYNVFLLKIAYFWNA